MGLKKAYYYLYYKLYRLAVSISDDALNEWKPLFTLLILEVLFLAQIFVWYSIITKKIIIVNNPLISFLPIVAVIGISNYFFFLHGDKWKVPVKEFNGYNKRKKFMGGLIIFVVVFAIVASVILSFYKLSQIDWKQYR